MHTKRLNTRPFRHRERSDAISLLCRGQIEGVVRRDQSAPVSKAR